MRLFEQAQQLVGLFRVHRGKAFAVPDIGAFGVGGLPRGDQVLAIGALALFARIFGVSRGVGHEMLASAAQHDFKAIAVRPFDHLPRNVDAAFGLGRGGHIGIHFPIALRGVGIGGCGRGVGDGRGRHDAGGISLVLGHFEQRFDLIRFGRLAIVLHRLRTNAQNAVQRFDAGDDGGCGRRAVGHLAIMRIGFDQGGVRQAVHLRDIGFAVDALLLPFKNAGGGQGGDAHAVADEDDDIARRAIVGRIRLQPGKLGCASL